MIASSGREKLDIVDVQKHFQPNTLFEELPIVKSASPHVCSLCNIKVCNYQLELVSEPAHGL